MPKILSIDGANRKVNLDPAAAVGGVLTFHTVDDIYKEYRAMRRIDESIRKFSPLLRAEGFVSKGGGKFTPRYIVLLEGTKLVIPNGIDKVVVNGEVLTDDATEPFDTSLVTGPVVVSYEPPEAEVIEVATGSGVTAQDKIDIAAQTQAKMDADSTKLAELVDVESNYSIKETIRLILTVMAGNIVKSGNNYSFRAVGNPNKERISGSVDAGGNRTVQNVDVTV